MTKDTQPESANRSEPIDAPQRINPDDGGESQLSGEPREARSDRDAPAAGPPRLSNRPEGKG
jgi:hypothetical protein